MAYQTPESVKRYRQSDKGKVASRNQCLKKMHGITTDDYNRMFAFQLGRCAGCLSPTPGSSRVKHFFVDHDHATGKIRGLLCATCNMGIGNLKDDPSLMRRLAEYVEAHKRGA